MPEKPLDARMEDVRVREGDGDTANMNEMVDWMLRVLSGGNAEAYVMDVLRRAEAAV